ncbi:biotin synthase [Achromobacter sp. HZ01]|uniref:Alpha/beta hydrolase n=1 Tax=Achromobacter pulmonis TaxID=1389932 RepID=A0A2N8KLF5_9BURK|nr:MULTISPECIES: alpha/beta hydrolase [Achromobacter]PND34281.1 alpha/beta hydrolase [Achromobacter pulmonis]RAP64628.1 biotin synthase [Achromobacter sp. HZ01]
MTRRPTLLFVHGWAFDASVWTPLRAELGDWPQAAFDAGYFGAPEDPAVDGPVIAIGHSLGALRLLRRLPPGCLGLAAINGFARFAAGPGFEAGVPPRMLDRMQKRLAADPEAVLRDFRQRCGADAPFGPPRLEPLERDLRALRDEDRRAALAALPAPLLVLAGAQDPIVPAAMTQAAFAGAPGCELRWREGGGHLLPVSDARWCADALRAFIARAAGAP